jgi:hypothetical protein
MRYQFGQQTKQRHVRLFVRGWVSVCARHGAAIVLVGVSIRFMQHFVESRMECLPCTVAQCGTGTRWGVCHARFAQSATCTGTRWSVCHARFAQSALVNERHGGVCLSCTVCTVCHRHVTRVFAMYGFYRLAIESVTRCERCQWGYIRECTRGFRVSVFAMHGLHSLPLERPEGCIP